MAILRRYAIDVPPPALDLFESGAGETLKPGDPRLPAIDTRFIATPQMALEAAATVAPCIWSCTKSMLQCWLASFTGLVCGSPSVAINAPTSPRT